VVDERVIQQGLAQAWKKGYVGTALTIRNDAVEQYIVSSPYDFDSITPENAMKWDATEPQRNVFTFSDADQYVNYSQTYKKELRCHNLVWHSQLPPWIAAGNFTNATLISVMENHIKNLAGRWGAKCTYWDVVNEGMLMIILAISQF
jgi:endo-1,4-beta-xylanase